MSLPDTTLVGGLVTIKRGTQAAWLRFAREDAHRRRRRGTAKAGALRYHGAMLENLVVFHVRGVPWTLGGVCVAISGVLVLAWACLMPYVANRYGTVKRMTTEQAQRRVFIGTEPTYLTGKVVAGPAAGKTWEVSLTIGGLRNLRERGEHGLWILLPAYAGLVLTGVFAFGLGLALLTRVWGFLGFSGMALLMGALVAFMMWASVYTQLE